MVAFLCDSSIAIGNYIQSRPWELGPTRLAYYYEKPFHNQHVIAFTVYFSLQKSAKILKKMLPCRRLI